jgi:hypothetical protein
LERRRENRAIAARIRTRAFPEELTFEPNLER